MCALFFTFIFSYDSAKIVKQNRSRIDWVTFKYKLPLFMDYNQCRFWCICPSTCSMHSYL